MVLRNGSLQVRSVAVWLGCVYVAVTLLLHSALLLQQQEQQQQDHESTTSWTLQQQQHDPRPRPHKRINSPLQQQQQIEQIVPPQCQNAATHFHEVQSRPFPSFSLFSSLSSWTTTNNNKAKIVLCCHRAWCHSFGHCDACAGVGDRTLHLLPKVHYAMQHNISIQLDYPLPHVVNLPSSVVYREERFAALKELLHYRSYHVSDRTMRPDEWGRTNTTLFAHFFATTPKGSRGAVAMHDYDPCWFHILFRPAASLQKELQRHMLQWKHNNTTTTKHHVIGIHFRTGDAVAFAGYTRLHTDIRTTGRLSADFDKMLACARHLAHRLYRNQDQDNVLYFVASDHDQVKRMANQFDNVYTTDCVPSSYLNAAGEKCTWMDLFLLLRVQGFVMNVVPTWYNGSAGRISTLANLVSHVNFNLQNKSHRYECPL